MIVFYIGIYALLSFVAAAVFAGMGESMQRNDKQKGAISLILWILFTVAAYVVANLP